MRDGSQRSLHRGLGLFDATMLVVGSMIGSGIFITSAESSRLVGAPGWLMVAWLLAGILTLTASVCCAELAAAMPEAGGQYVFFRRAYGPLVAFLYGWALFLVIQTGTIAAVAVAFANFVGVFFPEIRADHYLIPPIALGRYALSLSTQQAVAIGSIAVLTLWNLAGQSAGKWLQNILTATKTLALAALIGLGLTMGFSRSSAAFTADWWNPTINGWSMAAAGAMPPVAGSAGFLMILGLALVGPMFSQTAWNNVTFTGAEVVHPRRNIPRALIFGCGMVVGLYLLANLAYLVTLPWAKIQHPPSDRVGSAAMAEILGPSGTMLMAGAIVISTFGCNNGLILAGARVFYAMARDGLLFTSLARLNRWRVPGAALVTQGLWASALTLPRIVIVDPVSGETRYGNMYTQLLEYIVAAEIVFYLLMVMSVIILRRRFRWNAIPADRRDEPDTSARLEAGDSLDQPYRAVGYPLTPAIYLVLAGLVLADLVVLAPWTSGMGFGLVFTGLPVYLLWRQRGAAPSEVS